MASFLTLIKIGLRSSNVGKWYIEISKWNSANAFSYTNSDTSIIETYPLYKLNPFIKIFIRKKIFHFKLPFWKFGYKMWHRGWQMIQLVNHFWMSLMTWFQSLGSTHRGREPTPTSYLLTYTCVPWHLCKKIYIHRYTHRERRKEKYNKYQNYFNIADISSIKINNFHIIWSFTNLLKKFYKLLWSL